jgi:hypothetical protein
MPLGTRLHATLKRLLPRAPAKSRTLTAIRPGRRVLSSCMFDRSTQIGIAEVQRLGTVDSLADGESSATLSCSALRPQIGGAPSKSGYWSGTHFLKTSRGSADLGSGDRAVHEAHPPVQRATQDRA